MTDDDFCPVCENTLEECCCVDEPGVFFVEHEGASYPYWTYGDALRARAATPPGLSRVPRLRPS